MFYRLLLLCSLTFSHSSHCSSSSSSANVLIEELDALLDQSLKGRMIEQIRSGVGNETMFDMYYRSSLEELKGEELQELKDDIGLEDSLSRGSISGGIFVHGTRRIKRQKPEILGKLITLVSLHSNDADFCDRLKFIPFALVKFPTLQSLELSHNAFFTIPRFFADFKNLKSLDLSYNLLMHWPTVLGELTSLRMLNLSYNQLEDVSPQIGRLTNLRTLYLSGNQIKELPPQIASLKRLTGLDLRGNRLMELPESIKCLERLEVLILSENLFRVFPEFLGEVRSLKVLYLSFNASRTIPTALPRLARLQEIHISHHQMGGRTKDTIDQLSANRQGSTIPTLKVLLDHIKPSEETS